MADEEQIILPERYKRLEFLQSTGNEFIDTGLIPDDTYGFYAEVQSLGGTGYIAGTQNNSGQPGHWLKVSNGVVAASYQTNGENLCSTTDNAYNPIVVENNFLNNRKLIANGSLVVSYSETFTYNWKYRFTIFKSTYTSNTNFDPCVPVKIFRWKMSIGDKIVQDFIPAYDTVVFKPCMYDVVGRKAYYNKGTDEFTFNEILGIPHPLPAGFKKCAYLQSDGTQWINTQCVPDSETGIYIKAQNMQYGNFIPIGVTEGGHYIYPPRLANNDIYYHWGTSATKMFTVDSAGDCVFTSSINLYNSKLAKFDSEDTDMELVLTSQLGTFTLPIWFFSWSRRGSYDEQTGKWIGRIFRVKITQGDSLIHDYVPCLDANGRPCMYDIIGGGTVEDNTYYNQSGGTEFTYCVEHQLPSDFIKLRYLKSTGTQFIKTNHIPTNETGLYMDAYSYGGEGYPMGMRDSSASSLFYMGRISTSSQDCFWWGKSINIGYYTGRKFESTLNWLNDRQATITAPSLTKKVFSLGTLPFTPLYQLYLFGINRQDTSFVNPWNGQIYRAKISEGSEIIRDFVPAYDKRLDRPCMYDLINNVAYYNDGEDEFGYDKRFEGSFKGFGVLSGIGNKLGSDYNPINEKLPRDYTRIDFLEATGTQYITTDVYATGSMKFELEFLTKDFGGLSVLYGVFKDGEFSCFYNNYNNQMGHAGRFIYGSTYYYPVFKSGTFQADTRYKLVVDGHEIYRDGVKSRYRIGNGSTIVDSIEPLDFVTSLPISVFAHTGNLSRNSGIKRIYYFRASDNGGMKINFIPAINDKGKPCMFDLVTQQPYYNLGTEEDFIAGLKTLSHALQLYLPETGGAITLSVPTNDNIEYYEAKIRENNPNWTITFQYH